MVLHGLTNRGINGETDAIVFYDFGTGWIDAVPVKNRTNAETLRAFREVIGDLKEVNSFSFDTEREYAPLPCKKCIVIRRGSSSPHAETLESK